ncbi:2-amino-4-hydroxy-6-hydroxymethyldihydropteridine diphosphokinase [Candidatus Peregrinibacteria bacterium]|nr:2-amino-4-hydroxy-6-hydroxymethyldihydropteridine diphosphokinase [Candidatus Peregrinibacteria bacterium]
MTTVFIGLGSNIDAETNLKTCAEILRADYPDIVFSPVYKSAPREREDQADFLNAVARFETEETPEEVHATLQQIEAELGKDPPYPKGPRTIDLDVLLYGDWVSKDSEDRNDKIQDVGDEQCALSVELVIPHPRMHERRFVLEPLCELIDSHAKNPRSGERWNGLLEQVKEQKCKMTQIRL